MKRIYSIIDANLIDPGAALLVSIIVLLMANGMTGCDESLPPRNDPTNLFSARISGHYVYSKLFNGIVVNLTIVNEFDETFQEDALLDGSIRIVWERKPLLQKNLTFRDLSLTYAKNYDRRRGILTIDPGDSITFVYLWDLKTDQGVFIPADGFSYEEYMRCEPLRVTDRPEFFTLTGNVRIFDRLGSTPIGPTTYKLCNYGDVYIPTNVCAGSPVATPCYY